MKLFILLTGFFFVLNQAFSQELVDISKANTCPNAMTISTTKLFGPTTPPLAYGENVSGSIFANTQHPVWYNFKTDRDGVLLFDIIPIDTLDNYDFLLYKYDGTNFCQDLKENKVQPVRSNFYRTDISKQGKTGLSINGDGKAFNPGIDVKTGENYYLVLNNMYDGQGHSILFRYLETYFVKGKVIDAETKQPVTSTIIWENTRTKEETFTTQTKKNGEFELKINVSVEAHTFPRYSLYAFSEKYFISDTTILSKDLNKLENSEFIFEIPKIKTGYNYKYMENIYFEPNDFVAVPDADRILKKLLRMMNLNSEMTIVLEGHTNGVFPSTEVDEVLSESRAKVIKSYLTENGIDPNRIQIKGWGCNKQIYPTPFDETEEGFNRRVEINIVKF